MPHEGRRKNDIPLPPVTRALALRPLTATGAGKTYTAVTQSCRLLRYGGSNRVLFLADRNNLAEQTLAEFQNDRT